MKNIYQLCIVLALCAGCAAIRLDVQPVKHDPNSQEIVYDKNYAIGRQMTASPGQSMILWQQGSIQEDQKYIVFEDDFTLKFMYTEMPMPTRMCTITGTKGFEGHLQAVTKYKGEKYYVVARESLDCPTLDLLIGEDGTLNKSLVAFGSRGYQLKDVQLTPPDPHFTVYSKPDTHNGTTREMIFGGVNNGSITIFYREYSSDNLAKQTSSQNLSFDSKAETIEFKDIKIKVLEASNEKIVFTVLDDGGLPSCDMTSALKCQSAF